MTRNLTDDLPGWGSLFKGRAGDGTASVSTYNNVKEVVLSIIIHIFIYLKSYSNEVFLKIK